MSSTDTIVVGSGRPLLLAHGAGGSIESNYSAVIDALAAERTLIAPNYPGSGRTPRSVDPLELADLADSLVAEARAAGFEQFPLLGLSLGAAVAVTAAARHPRHVIGLLLTVGMAKSDEQTRAVVNTWRVLDRLGEFDALARYLLSLTSPNTLSTLDSSAAATIAEQIRGAYPVGGADQAALAANVDVTDLLPQVSVPTVVFVAGQDRIVLPSTTRALASGIPGAELIEYPDAGHIFTETESETWISDIRGFLNSRGL